MKEYQFILRNLGMNRDLSVSKTGESSAYENRNIRIKARDKDTLLSVTNERGTKHISLTIDGTLVGWNVLNNDIILFTHDGTLENPDTIYRVNYDGTTFRLVRGHYPDTDPSKYAIGEALFSGNLGFDGEHPIESVVYEESVDIKKIYWVDGKHVLRFMDFNTACLPREGKPMPWEGDNTYFDSNRAARFTATCEISKDNSGNTRANGVVQYLLTYFNEHGQETGYVWVSDLVYLSPLGRGGAADETNTNCVTLRFSNLDTSFTHFRVYSVFRSSLNGQVVANLVSEQHTSEEDVIVIDDAAHLVVQDTTKLLYLGSLPVIAGTITHKDQTLFIGDLSSTGRAAYSDIEKIIRDNMFAFNDLETEFTPGTTWESGCVEFVYSNFSYQGTDNNPDVADIPYVDDIGNYPYESQLTLSSSQILSFKGGEKYRFALKFKYRDGAETDAFWIGDKENTLYPIIDVQNQLGPHIKRIVAKCTIPKEVIAALKELETNKNFEIGSIQLLIAEATYADRSVKAQGIINPTMFNTWERYNNRLYSVPSWLSRPRGAGYANLHFRPVHKSTESTGEIQCNWWKSDNEKDPGYNYLNGNYTEEFEGRTTADFYMVVYGISYAPKEPTLVTVARAVLTPGVGVPAIPANYYQVEAHVVRAILEVDRGDSAAINAAKAAIIKFPFTPTGFENWTPYSTSTNDESKNGWSYYPQPLTDETLPARQFTLEYYHLTVSSDRAAYADETARNSAFTNITEALRDIGVPASVANINQNTFITTWCDQAKGDWSILNPEPTHRYFNPRWSNVSYSDNFNRYLVSALNKSGLSGASEGADRWCDMSTGGYVGQGVDGTLTPAMYKRHLMFIDENVVTLDSPELVNENVTFDKSELSFRIVGIAKNTAITSDYDVDATKSAVDGADIDQVDFNGNINSRSNINGLLSWPLFRDKGLDLKSEETLKENELEVDVAPEERTTEYYDLGNRIIRYWLYMWQHSGSISGFADEDHVGMSVLNDKTFANLHYCYNTIYMREALKASRTIAVNDLRVVNGLNNQLVAINAGSLGKKYYNGKVQMMLSMPGSLKYPVAYSSVRPGDTVKTVTADDTVELYSNAPVMLEYSTDNHAVLSFNTTHSSGIVNQTILPRFFDQEETTYAFSASQTYGDMARIPWVAESSGNYYNVTQSKWSFTPNNPVINESSYNAGADFLASTDQYFFIGEIYKDYSSEDTRYGGISDAAIQNNRFIPAGPLYEFSALAEKEQDEYVDRDIFANQGDTYFQRWDCLKTKPYSLDSLNKVIDITSFMVETHINLDGRSDLYRGMNKLASMNLEQFGQVNRVYSQQNNFSVRRDLDSDFNTDAYRSSITWTLPKSDMADVDEWTHITLASTLKLDSDKGICRALRRFNNGIVAFQDRAISEVLFNSMTPLSTTDSVPVEIANSGKVDGKRYVSNKYGCVNKWSISEGKGGLYFVDNINKAFCSFNYAANGKAAIDNLSEKLSFGVWFREGNTLKSWNPVDYDNIVSYYDKVHQDVYLVKKEGTELDPERYPSLVFNEILGRFTSFYDYGSVPMMANVEDKFISFHGSSLWKMGEGRYCNFFGQQYPFSVQYRVTPEPYGDKIWTNVEYRADVYKVLGSGDGSTTEAELTDSDLLYQPNKTFDYFRFWNEYQTTDDTQPISPTKKFRIWRLQIPRAKKNEQFNKYGLDRIRNPWLNLLFKQTYTGSGDGATANDELVQLHDITVKYFE